MVGGTGLEGITPTAAPPAKLTTNYITKIIPLPTMLLQRRRLASLKQLHSLPDVLYRYLAYMLVRFHVVDDCIRDHMPIITWIFGSKSVG